MIQLALTTLGASCRIISSFNFVCFIFLSLLPFSICVTVALLRTASYHIVLTVVLGSAEFFDLRGHLLVEVLHLVSLLLAQVHLHQIEQLVDASLGLPA